MGVGEPWSSAYDRSQKALQRLGERHVLNPASLKLAERRLEPRPLQSGPPQDEIHLSAQGQVQAGHRYTALRRRQAGPTRIVRLVHLIGQN